MADDDVLLEKIANHYLFYGSFHSDLGLYNGKMGMVIFFFHYARYTGNSLYEDFAEEFLNEILENLHTETPISFKRGPSSARITSIRVFLFTAISCGLYPT